MQDSNVTNLRNHISNLNNQLIVNLTKRSIYHGYKNPSATPLNYYIVDIKEFLKPIPVSQTFYPFADHFKILTEDVDICDYVDNREVKEVWIWMYHTSEVAPIESNMAMGRKIKNYWNYENYGDVSNSYRQNNLPICENTYVVYNYNYGRGFGEAIEDHTHQIEAVLGYIDQYIWGDLFVGQCGPQPYYRCGWTHYPPNVIEYCSGHDYDWCNSRSVFSNCEDWKPDGSGQKIINCTV